MEKYGGKKDHVSMAEEIREWLSPLIHDKDDLESATSCLNHIFTKRLKSRFVLGMIVGAISVVLMLKYFA